MFEDFDGKNAGKDKHRFGLSLALSGLLYGAIGGGVIAASAAARTVVQEEEEVAIEFVPPPEPEPVVEVPPPPPPTPTPVTPRPKAQRQELEVPQEIPDEKPPESDKPLVDAPDPGAGRDGFTDGVAGGTGSAPAPAVVPVAPPPEAPKPSGPVHLPEQATPPVALPGNVAPVYPEEARRAGIAAVVVAKIVVRVDGSVASVEILRGPEIFHASVKAALLSWHYEPAKLPDGTPISTFKIVQLPFRLENM